VRSAKLRRAALLFLGGAVLAGCAPPRTVITGPEGDRAARFFAGLPRAVAFPLKASFSGVARPLARDAVPFLAGVNAFGPMRETIGVYDPLGRGVAFLSNDGVSLVPSRGPAADLVGFRGAPPVDAGPVSLGRILSGAPGYPVDGGETFRGKDGGWVLSDERQTLYSDPGRRFLAKAEYRFPGLEVTVEYPGRNFPGPPTVLSIAFRGVKISLRRDPE
jgi:hypothetical protein